LFITNKFTAGIPSLSQRIMDRVRYSSRFNIFKKIPKPDEKQSSLIEQLHKDGFIVITEHIPSEKLNILKFDFQNALLNLQFDTPCLSQTKIDPEKHDFLIKRNMLATPKELGEFGLAIEKDLCINYEQVISEFKPSTLTVPILTYSNAFRQLWLDEYLLTIVSHYMGMVPHLTEAYVRRNFPAKYKTMNHFWHRDLNHPSHLLKIFFFLSDCSLETGPHEYVSGSYTDSKKRYILNNKRYYEDIEIDNIYPPKSEDRIISLVPAGTVIIEDTRGLHRANVPQKMFRDLGYAVFMPAITSSPSYYQFPKDSYQKLSNVQKLFIPEQNLTS
jgi:hypothetical protein